MQEMLCLIRELLCKEDGTTAIEYGLLAALVVLGIVTTVTTVGGAVVDLLNVVVNAFKNIVFP
ncbi:Flp family type IVb pilin [Paraburkholderia sp. A1BS-2L]|uniref:Flp family type IVb pilin n=1 Tax=Paraburkholderia sp. A1BS-2L TaxID=3028373 RepID=UPI003DA9CEE8